MCVCACVWVSWGVSKLCVGKCVSEAAGGGGGREFRTENKNSTQRCGEKDGEGCFMLIRILEHQLKKCAGHLQASSS